MSVFADRDDAPASQSTVTLPSPLESPGQSSNKNQRPRLVFSLFWRTFFLLSLLLMGCGFGWLQTFRALEDVPRALQTAQQIASLVNLTRAALLYSDAIARVSLIKTLADQEGVRILPREPNDQVEPYADGELNRQASQQLMRRLDGGTTLASSVNGKKGLWIGFTIDGDGYWLLLDPTRFSPVGGGTWLIWLISAVLLSLAGSALITGYINQPLKHLSRATTLVHDGRYDANRLDEFSRTKEIRALNVGFNRMADQLAKIEQDRAVMLAGISHDLRTPLARLRLETEMSVAEEDARAHMAADIAQLDAIIDKFLDYARPDHVHLEPMLLHEVIAACIYAVKDHDDVVITATVPPDLWVLADDVELTRVISNLVENARRYGRSPSTGIADISIQAKAQETTVLIKVRDRGPGVAAVMLSQLTKPFFRGDIARTAAAGAGLGLSIVAKTVERMGGIFALTSTPGRGFSAHIQLQRAPAAPPDAILDDRHQLIG